MEKVIINKHKTSKVICDNCKKEYYKSISEINRNKKLNRHSFCSLSCSTFYSNKHVPRKRSYEHLLEYNKKRGKNPFLYYLNNCRRRKHKVDIDVKYLSEIWENQKGICPYSGINLQLAYHNVKVLNPVFRASLDRIDSSKGYIKGNVQFISTSINYMKNTLTHEQTIELCKLISKKYICTFIQDWTISSSSNLEEMDAQAGN